MKKIISLLLIIALTFSCVSCSKNDTSSSKTAPTKTETSSVSSSDSSTSSTDSSTSSTAGSTTSSTGSSSSSANSTSPSSGSTNSTSASASSTTGYKTPVDSHTGINAEDEDDFERYYSSAAPNENIDVTLPLSRLGIATEEELNRYVKDNGYQKGVFADDETCIVTMTGAQHNELLCNLNTEIRDQLNDLVGSEDTPHVTSAEAIWNFTEFDIIFDGELNLTEYFLSIGLMYWGSLWNLIAGTPIPDQGIHIVYYDADSGDITYDSYDTQSTFDTGFSDDDWSFGVTTNFSEPTLGPCDLVNTDKVRVSITGFIPNDSWGYTINFDAENKTDTYLAVNLEYFSVNGLMIGNGQYVEISPNETLSSNVTIDAEKIVSAGIEEPTTISCLITAKDSDDWTDSNCYVRDTYTIYPLGEDRANEKFSFNYEEVTNLEKLYKPQGYIGHTDNGKDYGFVIYDVDPYGMWGYTFNAYVYNNTDKTLNISWNDFICDTWSFNAFGVSILTPGTCSLEEITFNSSDMEALNYDYIHSVCLHLRVTDYCEPESEPIFDNDYRFKTKPAQSTGNDDGDDSKYIPDPGDHIFLDYSDDKYSITIKSNDVVKTDFWGSAQYVLPLFVSQWTEQFSYVTMENVTLNGVEYEPYWGCSFRGNGQYKEYRPFTWSDDQLADMGIDAVETISFTLIAYDQNEEDEDKAVLMKKSYTINTD